MRLRMWTVAGVLYAELGAGSLMLDTGSRVEILTLATDSCNVIAHVAIELVQWYEAR